MMGFPRNYKEDPRSILVAWLGERMGMASNTVLYDQPLCLPPEVVRLLLDFRPCRASHENEVTGQVVHCQRQSNHDGKYHSAGYDWRVCRAWANRVGTERYRCILPGGHKDVRHDFGGWGPNYTGWSEIHEPEEA